MSTSVDEEVDTGSLIFLDFEPDIACESLLHEAEGYGAHEAVWYAYTEGCGKCWAMCDKRRQQASASNGWNCTGCLKRHYWDDIVWTPIEYART